MQLECPRLQLHKMAKRKEMSLIGPDKLQNYDIVEDPNGSESSSDIIGLSVSSNVTANEFYYDEDFAIPFDANLTDGQVAPLDDSLLLYSMTSDGGGVSSNQFSGDEATLSPYRTVVELSDSDEIDQSVMRRVTSSASEGGGSDDYWGTDSSLLRGCGVSVENSERLGVDVEGSGELDLSGSSDSLTQETDCDGPEVRLTTWAEVGAGSMRSLSRKLEEVSETGEVTTSGSSDESDQYGDDSRLVTWAGHDKRICHDPIVLDDDDRLKRAFESVDSVETGFMQNSGSQLALATGFMSCDASLVARDTNFFNGACQSLAAGMTTWRTLVTLDHHDGSSSGGDDIRSSEEDWSNDPECQTSPKRAESVSSPSSKDDGYDSVTKDLSMNDSQSLQDSDEVDQGQSEDQQRLLEGSASGADSVGSTMYPGVELPEILRQALAESRLQCSSISTAGDDRSRGEEVPYQLLDSSLVAHQTLEEQQLSVETVNPALPSRRVQDENSTSTNESMDSLNASISSSCQQSVVVPETPLTNTSASLWSLDADAKISSADERQGQQLYGAHTLPRLSKRMNSWSRVNSEAPSTTTSFVFRSLMRPLPDLGFLRKSSARSDRGDKQNPRICSEIKRESEDTLKEQLDLNSGYLRPHQNAIGLERDIVASSRGKESLSEARTRPTSSRFCPTLTRTRSRNSDSAFSEHSSASSGIDPGIVDLDDGYGTWNYRKSAMKVQNQLAEPWSSVPQEVPEAKMSCKEFGFNGVESRGINRKTERLVVKLCNACNIRTVHLEEENQTSQRSLPFSAALNERYPFTSPPRIIVSSADKTNNKTFAFDTIDLNENSRFASTALDTGNICNSTILKLQSISHKENTDTMSIAFDTVQPQDSRKLCQRNLEKCLSSEDNIQANLWSKLSGHTGLEALVIHNKNGQVIDGAEKRQQLLTNHNAIIREELEVNDQFANTTGPKTVYVEFDQEKDNALKRMERHGGDKRGKEIQIIPRANKNVSILENGVRFRPGFTPSEAASQCTVSTAVDRENLRTHVTAGVWNSATNSDPAASPVDDQPPVDFLVSPDTDSSLECGPSMHLALNKKADLLLNTMRSVESLLRHFNRNRDLQVQCGSTHHDSQVGHLVLDQLCPAIQSILLDGLKPDLQGIFGRVRNSVRQVIEDSATMGHPPNLVVDLVTSLKRLKFLNTSSLFFNAFVFALLNCKALDFWLSYIHGHASLLQKHYTPVSFLRLSDSSVNRTFHDLVSFLQPLALVPFRLEYNFEVRILEGRLEEEDRERHALEAHLAMTGACPGLNEAQENVSDTRLLVNSRKLEERGSFLGNAELVLLSESSDESHRNSWVESIEEFELNRQTHFALKSHGEGADEVGSSRRPPRSSPEVVEARVIPPVDRRTEPRVIGINHGPKYYPGCRNYQRNLEVMSPLRPDIQIIYNEQEEQEEQASRRADSSVMMSQHSNSVTRGLWSDYRQRIGLVKDRLEKLVFGTS